MAKAGMKWRKSPLALIAAFDAAFPAVPAERRQMFGYPAGFARGHMFTGLFQEDWFVRLGDPDRSALLEMEGARPFEPMSSRPMKDYVVLPPDVVGDRKSRATWLGKALKHVAGLPPKGTVKKAAKTARSRRR